MQAGNRLVALAAVGIAAVRSRGLALSLLVAVSSSWLVAESLKQLVDRPRPTGADLGGDRRLVLDSPGFPSTHTAVATGLIVTLLLLSRIRRRVAVGLLVTVPLTVAIARLYYGVHYPLDVLGGLLVGSWCGLCVAHVSRLRRRAVNERR